MRPFRSLIVLAVFLFPLTLLGASPNAIVVKTVKVDFSTNRMTITGENLGSVTPTVKLAGNQLIIESFNPATQTIVASLPGLLSPGTYSLVVSVGGGSNASTESDVTIGAVGAQGPAGPQGEPGPQGPAGVALPFAGTVDAFEPAFEVSNSGGSAIRAVSAGGDAFVAENVAFGTAGKFLGNVQITGTLSKGSGTFKIDHPLDPENKYLYHSFVESPDMMNIYNGNAVLDASGEAVVNLPAWFEALNRDFRYQLTSIGEFAPIYVAERVANNQFRIAGGKPGMEVSWQLTGIRHDRFANAHRVVVEEEKPPAERGRYLHPDVFQNQ